MSTYNGWTNYETWNYKLWLDSEQGTYQYWNERAAEIQKTVFVPAYDFQYVQDLRIEALASELENECEMVLEDMNISSGPFADILNAGVSQINWREIAESYLDDIEQ